MRNALILFFTLILLAMLAVTTIASFDRGVFTAGADLWQDPWFRATLADAYFGFLTIYLWIAYRERSWFARGVWFVLLMGLGNIAIAVYALIQLARLKPGEGIGTLLQRRTA
jgi:hypothetical protein